MSKFKTAIISLLFLCYFSNNAMATDCTPVNTNITLSTQTQVDDFQTDHGPCDTMTASLRVTGSDITNLDGLSDLLFIEFLEIINATALIDIAGLSSLSSVDDIAFDNAASLANLDGLSGLMTVNGFIDIRNNPSLQDIDELSNVNSVSRNLVVFMNPILSSLSGLRNVNSVELLAIVDNPALTSLDGLGSLTSSTNEIIIQDNALLADLNGLSQLRSVGQNLDIQNNPALNDCTALIKLVDDIDHAEAGPGPGSAGIVDIGSGVNLSGNLTNCNSVAEIIASVPNVRLYVDVDTLADSSCALGSCWEHAYTNLQDALSVVNAGDEIWVANGVYYPDVGASVVDNDRDASFILAGYNLIGGFAGNETLIAQRNPEINITILSGDSDENDSNVDNNFIAETPADIVGTNAYHVVRLNGDDLYMNGFTVTAGNASITTVLKVVADPITQGETDPRTQGAGVYCNSYQLIIEQMIFSGNHAEDNGDALYRCDSSQITNSIFTNNTSNKSGGAIFSSDIVVSNSKFINNSSLSSGGAIFGYGPFSQVTFEGNSSGSTGGALFISSSSTIVGSEFINNQAGLSGGAIRTSKELNIENSLFTGNLSGGNGGAINAYVNGDLTVINSTISGNKAANEGGGIWSSITDIPSINNSLLWNNEDSSGVGTLGASLTYLRSIPTSTNSIIQGSGGSSAWNPLAGTDGGNNIDSDPLFIAAVSLINLPNSTGDLHLQSGSPAINAGDNSLSNGSVDLDGSQRIQDATVDMGAYEFGTYQVLVTVPGLVNGSELVLQNNGLDDLSLIQDGTYGFANRIENGVDYAVSILSFPSTPSQQCQLVNATGTGDIFDIIDIEVNCILPELIFNNGFE